MPDAEETAPEAPAEAGQIRLLRTTMGSLLEAWLDVVLGEVEGDQIATIQGWDIGRWPGEFGWVYQASRQDETGDKVTIPLSVPLNLKDLPSRDWLECALTKAIATYSHAPGDMGASSG